MIPGLLLHATLAWSEPSAAENPSHATPDDARAQAADHARRAEEFVAQGRYDEANAELSVALALHDSPFHRFGLGMIAKLRGDCDGAIELFRGTVDALPDSELDVEAQASTRVAAEREIENCGGQRTPADPVVLPPPPTVPAVVDAPSKAPLLPPRDPARRRAAARDPAFATLVALGTAGILGGAALAIAGSVTFARADSNGSATGYLDERARGQRMVYGGIVTVSAGALLTIGAVWRLAVVLRRSHVSRMARRHSRLGTRIAHH